MDFGELGKKVGERWGALTAEEKKVRRTHAPPHPRGVVRRA
jgi:hypothetical protein